MAKVEILEGNNGYVIAINDYRISPERHNGIMKTVKSFKVKDEKILKALNEDEIDD